MLFVEMMVQERLKDVEYRKAIILHFPLQISETKESVLTKGATNKCVKEKLLED